jgi:hypothetical protein
MEAKDIACDKEGKLDRWIKAAAFIAEVPAGHKLDLVHHTYQRANGFLENYIWRPFSWGKNSQLASVNYIEGTFRDGKKLVEEFPAEHEKVRRRMVAMIPGINNQKAVYSCYPDTCQSLDRIVEKIREYSEAPLEKKSLHIVLESPLNLNSRERIE